MRARSGTVPVIRDGLDFRLFQAGNEILDGGVVNGPVAVLPQKRGPHLPEGNQPVNHPPEQKGVAPRRNRAKASVGDPLRDHDFDPLKNALAMLVDLLFDGRRENNVGGRKKIVNHVEIILVGLAELVIGGRDADKPRFGGRRTPAGGEHFPVKDFKSFSLQGGKDIFLVLKIEIDRADAQLGDAGDLVDRSGGQPPLEQELAGGVQDLLPSFGPFAVSTLFYPMVRFLFLHGPTAYGAMPGRDQKDSPMSTMTLIACPGSMHSR